MDVISHFSRELPLLRLFFGLIVAAALLHLMQRAPAIREAKYFRLTLLVCGVVTVALYLFLVFASLRSFVLDVDEANILSVAAAGLNGQQVYTPVFSTEVTYSLMYGPVTYWIYGHVLAAAHGSILAIRTFVVGVNLLLLYGWFRLGRRFLPPVAAAGLLALPISLLIQQTRAVLGARPDPPGLLLLTAGLLLALTDFRPSWLRASLVGISVALAVDVKLTMAPAAVFAVWVLYRRTNWQTCLTGLPAGCAALLLPFTASGVSARNYLAWLRFTGKEGVFPPAFWYDCLFVVYLLLGLVVLQLRVLPAGSAGLGAWRKWLPDAALLALVISTAIVAGGKPGAGTWYFFPLLPVMLAYPALLAGRPAPGAGAGTPGTRPAAALCLLVITYSVVALLYASRGWSNLRYLHAATWNYLSIARDQIEQVLQRDKDMTIQVGYGSEPYAPAEWLRYLPVLHGQPYTLDSGPRLEFLLVPFPTGIAAGMRSCHGKLWLIPAGQTPFAASIFPGDLSQTFLTHFRRHTSGPVYDVWQCTS